MHPKCHLRSHHHLSIDFWSIFDRFWTIFGSIFRRFLTIFGMHFCIQFSYRFWIGLGMDFVPEFQMFHNARTLKKLFSPQFLQCFVNVAIFRMRTEIIDNLLWNATKQASKFDGKSIEHTPKNIQKSSIFVKNHRFGSKNIYFLEKKRWVKPRRDFKDFKNHWFLSKIIDFC